MRKSHLRSKFYDVLEGKVKRTVMQLMRIKIILLILSDINQILSKKTLFKLQINNFWYVVGFEPIIYQLLSDNFISILYFIRISSIINDKNFTSIILIFLKIKLKIHNFNLHRLSYKASHKNLPFKFH